MRILLKSAPVLMLTAWMALAQDPAQKADPVTGSVELGYRGVLSNSGSFNSYRSVVNLGDGPKLLNTDLSFRPTKFFDESNILLRNWGGDPYGTLRVDFRKSRAYRLTVDHRSIALFNNFASFANPLLGAGSLTSQNALDNRIKSTDVRLDLLPSAMITPFVAYSRTSEQGNGIWVFNLPGNQFAVPNFADHTLHHYRGGIQLNAKRVHGGVEIGGTRFTDDQASADNTLNAGNLSQPYLDHAIILAHLAERYQVRGKSYYTRGSLAINPISWLSMSGEFVYTNPRTDVNYTQSAQGTFVVPQLLVAASSIAGSFSGSARMPRPSGAFRADAHPWQRLRIVEWWTTDRMHNATSGLLLQQFLTSSSTASLSSLTPDRLVSSYTQQQVDAYLDLAHGFTLHGGHRYTWGDAEVRSSIYDSTAGSVSLETARLRGQAGLAGLAYRLGNRIRANVDAEIASNSDAYFRTSLRDYRRLRARASYSPLKPNWRASLDFGYLTNQNPTTGLNLDFVSRTSSAVFEYLPQEGKHFSLLTEYTRATLHSRLDIIAPQTLAPIRSLYEEAGNSGTVLLQFKRGAWHPHQPGLSLGGSFYTSSGTQPTRYYQPQAKLSFAVRRHVLANADWRWYSMTRRLFAGDNFGSHQLTVSLTLFTGNP